MRRFFVVFGAVFFCMASANGVTGACFSQGMACTYKIGEDDPCCPGLGCGGGSMNGTMVNGICMECIGCSGCSSTDWITIRTGYEQRTQATCDCNTCTKTVQYRCAAGYYGTTTNGTSGCTPCPALDGVSGTSSAGNTLVSNCYIPENTVIKDSYGTYTLVSKCYY